MNNKMSINKILGEEIKNDNKRTIRNVIDLGEGAIEIYEPTNEQIDEFGNYYDNCYKANKKEIDFNEILFYLIPKLTNLDFSSISENKEVISKLFNNPPIYLRMVIAEIKIIFNEIKLIKIKELKYQMKELEALIEQNNIVSNVPSNVLDVMENVKGNISEHTVENYNKIIKLSEKIENDKNDKEIIKNNKIKKLQNEINKIKNGEDNE